MTGIERKEMKVFAKLSVDALCSYVPASIVRFLNEQSSGPEAQERIKQVPFRHSYETVVLFADVSGFTALSEMLAGRGGRDGAEQLAKHLNSYFEQLVRVVASQGGDVFKFAGDALIVLWPPSDENLTTVTRRAAQSAIEIQRRMHNARLQDDVTLSVKLGIGVGTVTIVHVGGVLSRMEYFATGSPLLQAFRSEQKAVAGQVVTSPEAWALIKDFFDPEVMSESGHAFLVGCKDSLRKVGVKITTGIDLSEDTYLIEAVSNYVPGAVLPFLSSSEERWASESRRVAVIFANLGFSEADIVALTLEESTQDLNRIQQVMASVQTAIYQYEGSVNKFIVDDKGSTLVAVFGLSPVAHEDDSARAILASLVICDQLQEFGLHPSIGITTGTAFCGIIGSRSRREYSVLGDVANLSARIMQHAAKCNGGVLCDQTTQYSARNRMAFKELGSIKVKGKQYPIKIFEAIKTSVAPHGIWNMLKEKKKAGQIAGSCVDSVVLSSVVNPHVELSRSLSGAFHGKKYLNSKAHQFVQRSLRKPNSDLIEPIIESRSDKPSMPVNEKRSSKKLITAIVGLKISAVSNFKVTELPSFNTLWKSHQPHKSTVPLSRFGKPSLHSQTSSSNSDSENAVNAEQSAQISVTSAQSHSTFSPDEYSKNKAVEFVAGELTKRQLTHEDENQLEPSKKIPQQIMQQITSTIDVNNSADQLSLKNSHANEIDRCLDPIKPTSIESSDQALTVSQTLNHNNLNIQTSCPNSLSIERCDGGLALDTSCASIPSGDSPAYSSSANSLYSSSWVETSSWDVSSSTETAGALRRPPPAIRASSANVPMTVAAPTALNSRASSDTAAAAKRKHERTYNTSDKPKSSQTISTPVNDALAHPFKATRIRLPDGRGHITIECARLHTLSDVKEKVFESLKRRHLVSEVACPEHFNLHLTHNQTLLANESLPLAVLVKMFTVGVGAILDLIMMRQSNFDMVEEREGCTAQNVLSKMRQAMNSLLNEHQTRTFVIEGEAGYGKSHLLGQAAHEAPAFVLFRTANPLESKTPFGVWRDIFTSLIDAAMANKCLDFTDYPDEIRKSYVTSKMSIMPEQANLFGVLNDVLHFGLDESSEVQAMSAIERLSHCAAILLGLLQILVNHIGHLIIVIDDALLIDKLSWGLFHRASCKVQPILIILATRPVNKSNLGAFDLDVPHEYTELIKASSTTRLILEAMTDEEVYQIGLEALGVTKLPNTLAIMLLQRSQGNPLVCKELLYALQKQELIHIDIEDQERKCMLSDQFTDLSVVPVPICLQNILGCRIDRLGHVHQLVLKVASMIGTEFRLSMLLKTYPIRDHLTDLQSVVEDMLSLHVLKAVNRQADDELSQSSVFRFVDGFMRDVIHSRLLVSQKQLLQSRIDEAKSRGSKKSKSVEQTVRGDVKYAGFMHVRKAVDDANLSSSMRVRIGQWKKRWVVLNENAVSFYYHPTHPKVLGVIFLDGSSLSTMPDSTVGREFIIQIDSQYWMKKGIFSRHKRLFYMSASNIENARKWSYEISTMIAKQLSVKEKHAFQESPKTLWTPEYSRNNTGSSTLKDTPRASSINLNTDIETDSVSHTTAGSSLEISDQRLSDQQSSYRSYLSRLRKATTPHSSRSQHNSFSKSHSADIRFRSTSSLNLKETSKRGSDPAAKAFAFVQNVLSPSISRNSEVQEKRASFAKSLNSSLSDNDTNLPSTVSRTADSSVNGSLTRQQTLLNLWFIEGHSFMTVEPTETSDILMRPIVAPNAAIRGEWMDVQVGEANSWTKQWVVLTPDSIVINESPKKEFVVAAVCLLCAQITVNNLLSRQQVQVIAEICIEGHQVVTDPKTFCFKSAQNDEITSWILAVQQVTHTCQTLLPISLLLPKKPVEKVSSNNAENGIEDVASLQTEVNIAVSDREDVGDKDIDTTLTLTHRLSDLADLDELSSDDDDNNEDDNDNENRNDMEDMEEMEHSQHFDAEAEQHKLKAIVQDALNVLDDPLTPTAINIVRNKLSDLLLSFETKNDAKSRQTSLQRPLLMPNTSNSALNKKEQHWLMTMMDECDIDSSTKLWLAKCYTRDTAHLVVTQPVSGLELEQPLKTVNSFTSETSIHSDVWNDINFNINVANADQLESWQFDIFFYDKHDLIPLLVRLYHSFGFIQRFSIDPNKLVNFVQTLAESYFDNAYHNFFHAVDTAQTVYCMLRSFFGMHFLSWVEMFALLTAAATHDVKHPGLGNSYQVNSCSKLALLYNDQSVLEHHHCASTFRILRRADCDIFENLSEINKRASRKLMISSILATDMTCHFNLTERFASLMTREPIIAISDRHQSFINDSNTNTQTALKYDKELNIADRETVANMILHSADISNQCKSWPVAKRWSDCIMVELFHQGDVERDNSLPLSPNTNRHTTDRVQFTLNFIDFVVAPLYVSLQQLLPRAKESCHCLRTNRLKWDEIVQKNILNSTADEELRREENCRWQRRMQSFDEIIMPDNKNSLKRQSSLMRRSSLRILQSFVKANSSGNGVANGVNKSNTAKSIIKAINEKHLHNCMTSIDEIKLENKIQTKSKSSEFGKANCASNNLSLTSLRKSEQYIPEKLELQPTPSPKYSQTSNKDMSLSLDDVHSPRLWEKEKSVEEKKPKSRRINSISKDVQKQAHRMASAAATAACLRKSKRLWRAKKEI